MQWRVPLSDLDYGPEEATAVCEVLESRWLTMGDVTRRFEEAFSDCLGVRHAIAVTNATAALHLANVALGIGSGDEVIMPSLTFVATANAVRYTGATPVFVDIASENDLCVDPESVQSAITPRTKAIAVMHYGGYPCDMPAIVALAKAHDLAVIEDAAHAPGAELDGRKAGAWGDIGCFSLFSNKNLATGEGGMIVTNRQDLADRVRLLRSHGMTTLTWDRHMGHAYSYDVVALGYNYRIDEMRAALGLVQLGKLETNNRLRRELSERYRERLSDFEGLRLPNFSSRGLSAAHLMPILLAPDRNRETFVEAMRASGVQTSMHYPPVHQFTYYRGHDISPNLPLTEEMASREVTLPLFPRMGDEQFELVVTEVENALRETISQRP